MLAVIYLAPHCEWEPKWLMPRGHPFGDGHWFGACPSRKQEFGDGQNPEPPVVGLVGAKWAEPVLIGHISCNSGGRLMVALSINEEWGKERWPLDSGVGQAAIRDMPPPTDLSTLRSFLGALNYYGRFIKAMRELRGPLDVLLKKDTPWEWGEAQQAAFDKAKKVSRTTFAMGPQRTTFAKGRNAYSAKDPESAAKRTNPSTVTTSARTSEHPETTTSTATTCSVLAESTMKFEGGDVWMDLNVFCFDTKTFID
uniref:RNA-directed DNA polymerase n=1 Tax=Globodera rostochiensis TaxID=31243 RepID=A0A914HMR8_GLORO